MDFGTQSSLLNRRAIIFINYVQIFLHNLFARAQFITLLEPILNSKRTNTHAPRAWCIWIESRAHIAPATTSLLSATLKKNVSCFLDLAGVKFFFSVLPLRSRAGGGQKTENTNSILCLYHRHILFSCEWDNPKFAQFFPQTIKCLFLVAVKSTSRDSPKNPACSF